MEEEQTRQLYLLDQGINPIAVVLLLIGCAVTWSSTRINAIKALFAMAFFIPLAQQFNVGGLHLHFFRIVIMVGLVRCVARQEHRDLNLGRIDKLIIFWTFVGVVAGLLRGNAEGLGAAFNALGSYFLIRCLTKENEDILEGIRFLALIAFPMSLFMCYEAVTKHNLLSILGGVPVMDDIRNGRARAQGAFRHAILAGSFGASLLPLMFALWIQSAQNRSRALLGTVAGVIMTVTAVSSGALMTLGAAFCGLALWKLRERMHYFRRGIVLVVIVFALVMKAPVWYLIARLSDLVGGGGWHRAYLIDQFVTHFKEWWLIGTSVTAHWGPDGQTLPNDPNNMDITNHYIAQGVHGGLLMFFLFILIIVACFKAIGRLWRSRTDPELQPKFYWMLGVMLGCHCAAFISISYFDQSIVFWFWLLATIAFLSQRDLSRAAGHVAPAEEPEMEVFHAPNRPLGA